MTIPVPPTELGFAESATPGTMLTLTVTAASNIGDIVYVVIGTTGAGVFPSSFSDSAGNVYNPTGSQLTGLGGGAAQGASYWSKLTAPLPIGGTIEPLATHSLMLGASRISGASGLQQTQSVVSSANNPSLTTGNFTQDFNLVFVVFLERNGASDTGYVEDQDITNDAIMAETDSLRWGWSVPVGRKAATYAPEIGINTTWGMIADTFSATQANIIQRRSVSTVTGPVPPPFVYDGYSPARKTVVGKRILNPDGSEWQGRGFMHYSKDVSVPGSTVYASTGVNDMAVTQALGAGMARILLTWFNNAFPIGTFTGSISGTTLDVTTPPTNPINLGEFLVGGTTAPGTTVTSEISVNSDGTGTYGVNISQTVAPATLTISPPYPCDSEPDSYDPNSLATGYIDPTHLALLDAMVAAAVAQGLEIDLGVNGGNWSLWTDPAILAQWLAMWTFLAARFVDTPGIVFLELLVEPHPTTDPFNNSLAAAFYRETIAAVRTVDPRTPFLIGPCATYNIRQISLIYLAERDDVIYTFNWYELGGGQSGAYVKQTSRDPAQTTPWTGYPSNPSQPDVNFPLYQDKKGDQPSVVGIYQGRGDFVVFNKAWQENLLSCALNFRDQVEAPLFCQQVGIRTDVPNALQWADDILSLLVLHGIGLAWFTFRYGWTGGGQVAPYGVNGDFGVIGQAVQNGPWIEKLGTGGLGDTWGNWAGMISGHLTAPLVPVAA